jgi:type III restriction enzyme
MDNRFFEKPILNSPYGYPKYHWELDKERQSTQKVIHLRQSAEFIIPIPKPRKRQKADRKQGQFDFNTDQWFSTAEQWYEPTPVINQLRRQVDLWRHIPNPSGWRVSPETAHLPLHWRHNKAFGKNLSSTRLCFWRTPRAKQRQA